MAAQPRYSTLNAAAVRLQALISHKSISSTTFTLVAAAVLAAQCAGLALAVQRVGCEFGQNPAPDTAACRGEAFLAALAVPNVNEYGTWDDIVLVLSMCLVGSIAVAATAS